MNETIQCSSPGCDLPDMHTGPHYPPAEIPAPGPGTILTGKGFIAAANRVAEFIRQYRRGSLLANRRDSVIYALHSDPAAQPIELTVDDLELILKRALPVMYPDRDDLARAMFMADNSNSPEPDHEWEMTSRHNPGAVEYVYVMADAAIEAFRKSNP
jgi:hypothetical protein